MNKEMLDILNDLSKKPTTGLALQIMELSTENLILEKQVKEQKSVIDRAINYIEKESAFLSDDEYGLFNKKELLDILKEAQTER